MHGTRWLSEPVVRPVVPRVPAATWLGTKPHVTSTPRTDAINPANVLTTLRMVLAPVVVGLLLVETSTTDAWALAAFVVASATDSADGYLARRRAQVTRWGKLADPVADKVLVIGTLAALAVRADIAWWVVAVIALREIAVTAQRQLLLRDGIVMSASQWGKLKTLSQVIAITLVIAPFVGPTIGTVAMWVAVALTVASGLDYAIRGARRARAVG